MADHVSEIMTRQDYSAFARAHADEPVHWEVRAGPGGTMIIIEHDDPEAA